MSAAHSIITPPARPPSCPDAQRRLPTLRRRVDPLTGDPAPCYAETMDAVIRSDIAPPKWSTGWWCNNHLEKYESQ